ncbi:hypothetical protein [Chelativorans sp. AA-79]|uniref:lysozyme inhibitor LprI family protein n=1 Tax=Chelativorans sp. AA-79 TaxID=3028735 RepID=UPI0023F97B9D|nr:hypothetical protein [Chelativorans sp. AA-79]WEX08949.1 hypothetical protein PVE73_23300 [Chelativorans sp. AA-79]
MLRILSRALVFLCLSLATVPASRAASFDCTKATAPDEITICQDPALSELDSAMAALWFSYEKIPFLMGGKAARREEAEAFLETRRACGSDAACLRKVYEARIEALKTGIGNYLKGDSGQLKARQWSSANLPGAVQALSRRYRKMCSDIGGTLQPDADEPMMMTADIDGDGVQDFVLNPQNMRCSAAATAFCGNGGCPISLALSGRDYEDPVTIMGGAPSLSQDEEGTSLDVWVGNAKCETTQAASSCQGRFSWHGGKLVSDFQARQFQD